MIVLQVTTFCLAIFAVGAEKKIELQDIEEDNLRSEKQKDYDKPDSDSPVSGPGQGLVPLEYLKSGLLKYFENPPQNNQEQRYVHQYAVTEAPERPAVPVKPQYSPTANQQAMVGYLPNLPLQIYLVPQYYTDQPERPNLHPGPPYQVSATRGYQSPEALQSQTNFIQVPSYTPPTAKTYIPQYQAPTGPVTYLTYSPQPTIAPPQPTVAPVVYQVPVQYQPAVIAPTSATKVYYQNPQYTETNSVDDGQEQTVDQKHYTTPPEISYHKPNIPEYPRYYNSRAPVRDDYRHNVISQLPHPNPLLLKGPPPHLAHVPKSLPFYRPQNKPIYQPTGPVAPIPYPHRPEYGPPPPYKRRPTSLLDSYIPSSLQLEYLKRGLVKDPLAAYDAIASGRLTHPVPRNLERGFLPNQMYHTGAGGVTFGHYKRTPKIENAPRN